MGEIRALGLLLAFFGVLTVCAGFAAYKGIWREWKHHNRPFYDGPGCVPFGILQIIVGIFPELLPSDTGYMFLVYFAPLILLSVVPCSEWPLFLLPGWYAEEIRADREVEDAKKRLRRDRRRFIRAKRKLGFRSVETNAKALRRRDFDMSRDFGAADLEGLGVEVFSVDTPEVLIRYPDIFTTVDVSDYPGIDSTGVDTIIATVEKEGLAFRPNLVVTSVPSSLPLVDAAVIAYESAEKQHPGARIINVDMIHTGEPDFVPLGRLFHFIYPYNPLMQVMVKKWVYATGSHHIHFSASYLPSQAAFIEPAFDWIINHAEIKTSQDTLISVTRAESQIQTRLDSRDLGFPLEDVSGLGVPQVTRSVPVETKYVDVVAGAWKGELYGPLVHVNCKGSGLKSNYVVYGSDVGMVVVRSSGGNAYEVDEDCYELYGLTEEQVLADVLAWLGLRPQFVVGRSFRCSVADYYRHVGMSGQSGWQEINLGFLGQDLRLVRMNGGELYEAVRPGVDEIELSSCSPRVVTILLLQALEAYLQTKPKK